MVVVNIYRLMTEEPKKYITIHIWELMRRSKLYLNYTRMLSFFKVAEFACFQMRLNNNPGPFMCLTWLNTFGRLIRNSKFAESHRTACLTTSMLLKISYNSRICWCNPAKEKYFKNCGFHLDEFPGRNDLNIHCVPIQPGLWLFMEWKELLTVLTRRCRRESWSKQHNSFDG